APVARAQPHHPGAGDHTHHHGLGPGDTDPIPRATARQGGRHERRDSPGTGRARAAPPNEARYRPAVSEAAGRRVGTSAGRWVLVATVLGSGVAFLDGTVVNVALPRIAADFNTGLSGLQWVLDAYMLTLTALILLGGSLGDLFGRRRVFLIGLAGFS